MKTVNLMFKSIVFTGVVLIAVGLLGCDTPDISPGEVAGSTYTGVVPCADCEGIAYRLSLKDDHRFESSSVYIGKSKRPYIERGTWRVMGDSLLILNESEEHAQQFKIKNKQLVILDPQGKETSGSLSKMFILGDSESMPADTTWKKRRAQGIDFRAVGSHATWSLNINFDDMMLFRIRHDTVRLPVPRMRQDTISQARTWYITMPNHSLKIEIYPIGCVDDSSDEVFTHFVHVIYNDQPFRGCGNFINPRFKLNDFWEVQSVNGVDINEKRSDGKVPALQFDVAQHRVSGNTGCNQLQGNISVGDSSLSFSQLGTTRRACRGDNLESEIVRALKRTKRYEILQARLLLKDEADTMMVLRRAGTNE